MSDLLQPTVPMHGTPEILQQSGGIYYFETDQKDSDEPQPWVNIMGVELPTQSNAEQVAQAKSGLVLGELGCRLLRTMAETYALRQPLLLEGDPSSGKTYLTEKFLSFLNANQDPLSLYGTPRTSEHEINGHYSPSEDGLKFIKGALLEAATANSGTGRPLFVDEFGLIPSNYQQLFLPISGEHGSIAKSVTAWGNGDKQRHAIGPDAWFAFATNFPERTLGRNLVTDAMASRVVWMAITDTETAANEQALIVSGMGRSIGKPNLLSAVANPEQTYFDLTEKPELAELITDAVAEIHGKIKRLAKNPGDSLGSGEAAEPRIQPTDFTPRDAARLYNYIQRFPIRDPERHKQVDVVATLEKAFTTLYLARFASPQIRLKAIGDIEESLNGSTSTGSSLTGRTDSRTRAKRFLDAQAKTVTATKQKIDPTISECEGERQLMSTPERLDVQSQIDELRAGNNRREALLAKIARNV